MLIALLCALALPKVPQVREAAPHAHDVVWHEPSANAGGSMPLGNGDIALNAWIEASGALVFQRLDLGAGALVANFGMGEDRATLRLWVDANHDLAEDRSQPGHRHEPLFVEPDTLLENLGDRIGWLHFNQKSVGPAQTAQLQGLSEYFAHKPDPLLHRVFGAVAWAAARTTPTSSPPPAASTALASSCAPSTPRPPSVGSLASTPASRRSRAHRSKRAAPPTKPGGTHFGSAAGST